MSEHRRVVISGVGAVTPIGNSVPAMWEAAKNGKCGIAPITHFDTEGHNVTLAAEVKDFNAESVLSKAEIRKTDDFTIYALAAAKEAIEDSMLNLSVENLDNFGVIVGSGIGGITTIQRETLRGEEKGYERLSPHFIPMSIGNMAAGQIAIKYGLHGKCSCTACASGTDAIGESYRAIKDGYQSIMLCGGAEACATNLAIGGFASMKALSASKDPSRASIPFDKERNGFVLGEGAGILILEEYTHAVKRGAKIYAEILGYSATCDAFHVTAPLDDGSMAARCMGLAIAEARIAPVDIKYVNAHGTSTALNDKCETKALKRAFGDAARHLMISSTKSMTGHMLGASGAVEAIVTALALKEGVVPPTVNYKVPDPECDLDIVPNTARECEIKYAMSNSLGFGGHNASLVFKKV